MSKKRDFVKDDVYARHLYGDMRRYAGSPAVNRQVAIERMYTRILTELACNRFKWTGLPDSVNVRYLELTLFYRALSVFYDDPEFGYVALQGTSSSVPNVMMEPTEYRVTGAGPFPGRTLKKDECVPIWSNYLRVPDIDVVMIYANRLSKLDRTIEINSENARRTKVIVADENQRLSLVNINAEIDKGSPVIQVAMPLGKSVDSIDLGVNPDSIEKLDILHSRQWGKCLGLLGIDFANQDKKERLVSREVDANNAQVGAMRAVNLNERKLAAYQINNKYGLNVGVEFNEELDVEATFDREAFKAKEVENDDIYNDAP